MNKPHNDQKKEKLISAVVNPEPGLDEELKNKLANDIPPSKENVMDEEKEKVLNDTRENHVNKNNTPIKETCPIEPKKDQISKVEELKVEEVKQCIEDDQKEHNSDKAKPNDVEREYANNIKKSVLLLSDESLYKELLAHTETVSSFRRLFERMKLSTEIDPLMDIELDQGRRILYIIWNKIQEQFYVQRNMPNLYTYKNHLYNSIEEIQNLINELLPRLKDENYDTKFAETM